MGSCFASAPKQDNNPIKRPSKLKVVIPKNPLLDTHTIYKEMPFRIGDCFQLNKNPFHSEYEVMKVEPVLQTEYGKFCWCLWKKNPIQGEEELHQKRIVKMIKKSTNPKSDQSLEVIQNIYMMRYLDHPNILKIIEYFDEQDYYYIIFQEYIGGNLVMKFVNKGQDQEYMSALIAEQLLSALQYLHSKNLQYRFISHQYILCDDDLNIMLVEMGATVELGDNKGEPVGDLYYQSPEMMYGRYGIKADIWAVGVLLYFLLCGSMPFDGILKSQIKNAIMRGETKLDTFEWDKKKEARNFIQKLLTFNSKQRPTALDALREKWIESAKQKKSMLKLNPALTNLRKFQKCEVLVEAIIMQIVQMTLTPEQKAEIHRIFIEFDTNKDGLISTQELIQGNEHVQIRGYKKYSTSTKLDDTDIEKLVNRIDSNGNGQLDYSEFLLACQDKKKLLTVERLKLVFAQLDVDRDNTLSMKEMRRIFGGNRISDQNWHNILRKTNLHHKTVLSELEFLEFISKAIQGDNNHI